MLGIEFYVKLLGRQGLAPVNSAGLPFALRKCCRSQECCPGVRNDQTQEADTIQVYTGKFEATGT